MGGTAATAAANHRDPSGALSKACVMLPARLHQRRAEEPGPEEVDGATVVSGRTWWRSVWRPSVLLSRVGQEAADGLSARNGHSQLGVHTQCAKVGDEGGQQEIGLALSPTDLALSHPEPFGELNLRYSGCAAQCGQVDHHLIVHSWYIACKLYMSRLGASNGLAGAAVRLWAAR